VKRLDFQNRFTTHANTFLQKNGGENAAVFFRGFGRRQIEAILNFDGAVPDSGILNPDGTLNISKLESKKAKIADSLLTGSGLRVGIYEQLLAALSAVQDLATRYAGKIIIVENNLFAKKYPAVIPTEDANALYNYFQGESELPDELSLFLNYYGGVDSIDEKHFFTFPLSRDQKNNFEVIHLFPETECSFAEGIPAKTAITVSGNSFLALKADLLDGIIPNVTDFALASRKEPREYSFPAFAEIMNELGVPCKIYSYSEFNQRDDSANLLLPLLRKHWGANADFRSLEFYAGTSETSEGTVTISQGEIVAQIVHQCEAAIENERDYHDLFITAPTGAGKSLLFQLPALHLAKQHNKVTIVITPLIALMKDQVSQLETERGINCATYINSTLSFEEREKRIAQIHSGEKSIVYLAPELLVNAQLETITGGRPLGLFVIDEAHIVTSWGKDFRADYWYLGDFLKHMRQKGARFPVLCLTATAIYGGAEDVVNETISSLFLNDPLIYLGSVRRNNIEFDIRHVPIKSVTGGVESFKVKKAAEIIKSYVEKGEKSLVYCPFTTQVDDIYTALDPTTRQKVKKYYGTLDKQTRDEAQNCFRQGECTVMICTKAFGMGIDVKDIRNIYHFAPTGSLADYVQEVGRAARETGSSGNASADFLPTDIRYVRTLYSISEMKQYQLREMLRKVLSICKKKGQNSFYLSPDAFQYLFSSRELENKVKNGLLLLEKDLEQTAGYPILTVRPQSILTESYVNVPRSCVKKFDQDFGQEIAHLNDGTKRIVPSRNKRYESDTTVINSGEIYKLDMLSIWEKHYQGMSYSQFNHKFFTGELFPCTATERFSPRIHIRADYKYPFPELLEKLKQTCMTIASIFRSAKSRGEIFTVEEFKKWLGESFGEEFDRGEFAGLILDLFVADISRNVGFRANSDRLKFITSRKSPSGAMVYRVMNTGYLSMPNYFVQLASQCPPDENNVYQAYIPLGKPNKQPERLRLFSFLELFGLASYQVRGSQNMEIFIRINDMRKLEEINLAKYSNGVLTDIKRRHKVAQEIMMSFMSRDLTSEQRWNVIEDYFLGHEDAVRAALKSSEDNDTEIISSSDMPDETPPSESK
jgi:ATP-dependent DNA helicase RecQ